MSVRIADRLYGSAGLVALAFAAFALVAVIGVASTALRNRAEPTGSSVRAADDSEQVARLKDYARSVGVGGAVSPSAHATSSPGAMQADVNTMIERLARRLMSAPDDVKGWRMLGWSYFHTERYKEAADAFAKAVALDASSAELKKMYEEAKRAAEGGALMQASAPDDIPTRASGGLPTSEQMQALAEMPPDQRRASIRAMVDGLATRLESEPRDVEGWSRLMRSRVVLGETDVAATALRKALDVFKEDPAASARISAVASELGLAIQ